MKTILLKDILLDLKPITRPRFKDAYFIKSLDNRKYQGVNVIKALFKVLKSQKTEYVLLDCKDENQITIVFNNGCSEYTIKNLPTIKEN